jgi:hypothetical protein
MSLLNYFLIMFAFVAAGLAACVRGEGFLRLGGVLLGGALILLSFAFWKLDQRSAFLVKHAENALREIEMEVTPEVARLFRAEPEETQSQTLAPKFWRLWTYGGAFRLLFCVAALVGLGGGVLSLVLFLG